MSIGRSKEEQELNSLLAKTLVAKEVIEPMTKIGWGHGSPPTPDYTTSPGGQPAPSEGAPGQAAAPAPASMAGQPAPKAGEQPAPADKPKADGPVDAAALLALYESLRDPATGLILKKYKTFEAAVQGSGHLAIMAKQAFKERDEALARLSLPAPVIATSAPAASPAAVPASKSTTSTSRAKLDEAQAKLDEVLSGISENGGILDSEAAKKLSKAQREVADAAADYRVQESRVQERTSQTEEQDKWKAVDSYMVTNHPESAQFSEEVALYMQSDPLLAAAVNALLAQEKRLEATLLAWKSFEKTHTDMLSAEGRAKAEEKEMELTAREQVRKEKTIEARKDAGVIVGSPGGAGAHENRNAAHSREEIEAVRDQMRREGDAPGSPAALRFRQMVIGPSLDPRFFGPGA